MAGINTYTGFSTIDAERTRSWKVFDVELVRVDLMNHFMTRVGERLGRPEFGCRIWDMLHEQMTPGLREDIINEAVRICASDPRVKVHEVFLFDFDNGIRIQITLDFVGLAAMQQFEALFEIDQATAYNQSF
jgi:phage baseplate assembly protein W